MSVLLIRGGGHGGDEVHHYYRQPLIPTSSDPLEVGDLWSDTTVKLLKRCTSISPITFVSVEGGSAAHNILSGTHSDTFAADVPANNDVLTWVAVNSRWEAVAASGATHALGAPSTLTIAVGKVTVSGRYHLIDTEGLAASDNLAGMAGGANGDIVSIRPANDARTVVVTHEDIESVAADRFNLPGDASLTLDDIDDLTAFVYDGTIGRWILYPFLGVRYGDLTGRAHVLADGAALGPDHTVSGAAAGEVLRALSATTAAFDQLQHTDLGGVTTTQHHSNVNDHSQSHSHALAADGDTVDPGVSLKLPRKADPGTPVVGEAWVNVAAIKVRDNSATPATRTLVHDGTTAAGELAGTYPNPTVAATHSGTAHHTRSHDHSAAADGQTVDPGVALRAPRKTDPATPLIGEVWVNIGALKWRTNDAVPETRIALFDGQTALGELTGTYPSPLVAASHSGTRHRLDPKTISIVNPAANDDFGGVFFDIALTITNVYHSKLGGTNVVYNILHATTRNAAAPNKLWTIDKTVISESGEQITVFDDNTIPANSYVWWKVTSISGVPTRFESSFKYTVD